MANLYGPQIVTSGLILCLDAANTRSYSGSGTSWIDLSGNNNTGTLLNGTTFSSSNRGNMILDGTDDYITVNYASNNFVNANFTWSVWVKASGVGNTNMPKIGYGSGSWPRLGFRIASSTWYFSQYNSAGPPQTTDVSIGPESASSWLNLVATANYGALTIRTYRNGSLFTNSASYKTTDSSLGLLGIGRSGDTAWPDGLLSGSVSQFSIYNRVLSDNEVLQNFNALKGRFNL